VVRFPWGSVLALGSGSYWPPLRTLRERAVAHLRHRRNHLRCSRLRSRPFAWSGRRRIDEAIRCRQLRAIAFRRTTRPTPFQRRGCEPLLDLLGPRGAFTEPRRPSDVPVVTRGHARPASVPTDALSASHRDFRRGVLTATEPASRRTSVSPHR
jgi:hypothetical protein